MAAKKGSRGKSRGTRPKARKGGAKSARKSGARKSSARKASAKRPTARKKSAAKKSPKGGGPMKRSSGGAKRRSPIQRVTNVARQVAQQAQAAVSGGVDALREMGETIAERVGGQD